MFPSIPPMIRLLLLMAIRKKDMSLLQSISLSDDPAIQEAAYLAADAIEPALCT